MKGSILVLEENLNSKVAQASRRTRIISWCGSSGLLLTLLLFFGLQHGPNRSQHEHRRTAKEGRQHGQAEPHPPAEGNHHGLVLGKLRFGNLSGELEVLKGHVGGHGAGQQGHESGAEHGRYTESAALRQNHQT